jgi:uncharacterized protein (DUF983 family)
MDMRGFYYERLDEDSNCTFCGTIALQGTNTCSRCGAVHGSRTPGIAVALSLIVAVIAALIGFFVRTEIDVEYIGWVTFVLVFIPCTVSLFRSFTKKGWFR